MAVWGLFLSLSPSVFQWKIFRVWIFSPLLKCQHFPKGEGGEKRRKEKHVLTSSSQSQKAQSWIWSGKYAGGEKTGVSWFHTQPGWAEGCISRSIPVSHYGLHFPRTVCGIAFKHSRSICHLQAVPCCLPRPLGLSVHVWDAHRYTLLKLANISMTSLTHRDSNSIWRLSRPENSALLHSSKRRKEKNDMCL